MVRYSPEIAAEICERLAAGESLRAICRDLHMPEEAAVRQWVAKDLNGFASQYAQAREAGYHVMADEILEIADDSSHDTVHTEQGERPDSEWIARSKLRVDSRKWLLSKMLPKVYGDTQKIDLSNTDGTLQLTEAARAARVAELLAIAQARVSAGDGSELL
jgi:hypothetical protein